MKLEFSQHIKKKKIHFMKITAAVVPCKQIGKMKIIVTFCNFVNVPKKKANKIPVING
jgi:hypothetical protein